MSTMKKSKLLERIVNSPSSVRAGDRLENSITTGARRAAPSSTPGRKYKEVSKNSPALRGGASANSTQQLRKSSSNSKLP